MNKLAVTVVVLGQVGSAFAQVTERVSVDSNGGQSEFGGEPAYAQPIVSADGRYVVFASASVLDAGDTNGQWDVFVRDRVSERQNECVSIRAERQRMGVRAPHGFAISPNGRYVAVCSSAYNLVAGDTNLVLDIFLVDRVSGTTERVNVDSTGVQGNAHSYHPSLSPDGRYVAFESMATNLVPADANAHCDAFLHDRLSGTTELISVTTSGAQGNGDSWMPVVSADGRYVAFTSQASNLVGADTNGHIDVFVRDRQIGLTMRISRDSIGAQGNHDSYMPSISSDGRFVAFTSDATNLVAGDTNGSRDVFIRDLQQATTELVSVSLLGVPGNHGSQDSSLSADGRYVAFQSSATDLVQTVPFPLTGWIFLRDRWSATTELVSVATDGSYPIGGYCAKPGLSADARYVAFSSYATNLAPSDTNGTVDVFLRDRFATGFASLCDPGVDNVIACPCANPSSTAGRGCDNSAATGGASLSASGTAYLSLDRLTFTSSRELPTALSIVLQGDALATNGLVFGQGVRCAAGSLKRLYTKSAVGGVIIAPTPGAGDPKVSGRSASLGDTILGGQSRWYVVYYRDPTVLGGCFASSTFNVTQTGQITWWP